MGRLLDDAWEHGIPLDKIRQGVKCIYCDFVSKRGGITRLKIHLVGGDPILRLKGCSNVPLEVKRLMARDIRNREIKECANVRSIEEELHSRTSFQVGGAVTEKSIKRGRPLDDAWEHAIPLDEIRQGAKCIYCGFVSKRGGIARLKLHLGGGEPLLWVNGCSDVPLKVKRLMAEEIKKFRERTECANSQSVDKELRVGTRKSAKRGRPLDDAWEHAVPLDKIRQGVNCIYCNFVSKRGGITRLKKHLGGGDPILRLKACSNVPPEVKRLMAEEIKKCTRTIDFRSQATVQESQGSVRVGTEIQRSHAHIPQETAGEVTNFLSKASLQKLIAAKNVFKSAL